PTPLPQPTPGPYGRRSRGRWQPTFRCAPRGGRPGRGCLKVVQTSIYQRSASRQWGARMDDVERLIEAFRARSRWSVLSKLDALLDLEQLDDPRIVPFLLHVLADQHEPTEVRIHVLKRLRNGRLQPADRQSVAEAVLMVLSDRSSPDLRLQAVLALAEFTSINGVPATLGSLALDSGETIDVRYSAFTSLQRAGPTVECVAVLRQLLVDGMLGRSARTLLSLWRF